MGLCLTPNPLLASVDFTMLYGTFMAAAGLGFVIFVHELGHFLVARACGVKCDKFMVGFDFFGLKLSRKWGETEYGIGVFPLGGYVKMLGQDDDPSKSEEQIAASQVEEGSEFAVEKTGPNGERRFVDRRSYQAKTVPQRMAIISAGVVMNIIFAVVFAFFAYGMGVDEVACVISHTSPGGPAWRAGLEPNDEIVQIGDRKDPSFRQLSSSVTLGDMTNGVEFKIRRATTGEVEDLVLVPEKMGGLARIGVAPPRSNRVVEDKKGLAKLAQDLLLPPVEAGDEIVAIDGQEVSNYREVMQAIAARSSEPLTVTVARKNGDDENASPTRTEIAFEPIPARRLGIIMTMGPIMAIQQGSPAEAAGLKPGDKIVAIDGKPIGAADNGQPSLDPATLPELLAASQEPVELSVVRAGSAEDFEPDTVTVTPRAPQWVEVPSGQGPMPVHALGLCYSIEPVVVGVIDGSPAAEAGVTAGDRIKSVTIVRPATEGKEDPTDRKFTVGGDEGLSWPALYDTVRRQPADATVKLKIDRGGKELEQSLATMETPGSYLEDRRLSRVLGLIVRPHQAASIGEQAALALDETGSALTHVLRVLEKLTTQQLPTNQLGGPLTILEASYNQASASFSGFLLFLTLLSANLAVLNFLPIPVLDGGHMVFLAWEGITGKPANERLTVALHVVGLVLLLSLMIFVTKNDIVRIFFSN